MKKGILAGFILFFISGSSTRAEIEIGFSGLKGWSDNFYLEDPYGWGVTASKTLPNHFAVRLSYSRLENNFIYDGKMLFGLVPVDASTPRERISSRTAANLYELSLHYIVLNTSRLRFDFGTGIGGSSMSVKLVGNATGKTMSASQIPLSVSVFVGSTVNQFIYSRLSLRVEYQYRSLGGLPLALDGFQPFNDVNLSGVRLELLAGL